MPAYEYICKDCNKEFVVFLSIKEFEAKRRSNVCIVEVIMSREKLLGSLQKRAKNHSYVEE